MFSAVVLVSLAASLAIAHPHPAKRQNQTEGSFAGITNPTVECQMYDYPPMDALAPFYPQPYTIASIQPGDSEGQALFNTLNAQISAKLPNDQPQGSGSYPSNDPDCWFSYQQCTTPDPSTGLEPDLINIPIPNAYALTIDDGPLCDHNAFYDFLAENNQKATMFYIGSNIMSYPLQALRGFDDGHQICVHTWSHHSMTHLTNEQVFAELYYTRKMIKDLMGVTPLCWRPPYGDVDNRVRAFAAGLNLTTIIWDQDTSDWSLDEGTPVSTIDANYEQIIAGVKNNQYTQNGPIVLCHELSDATMAEIMKFYAQIKAAFSYILPVATALNQTHPYVETSLNYPTFSEYTHGQVNQTNSSTAETTTSTPSRAAPISLSLSTGSVGASASASAVAAVKADSNAQKTPNSVARGLSVDAGLLLAVIGALTLL